MRLIILFLSFLVAGCSAAIPVSSVYEVAPTLLPHTTREMKTPGFWISRHPSPDLVALTSEEIKELNRSNRESKLIKDILQTPASFPGTDLRNELEKNIVAIQEKDYFNAAGDTASAEYFETIKTEMDLSAIPAEIRTQYGFIVRFSDQRFFPTEEGLYAKPGDLDFDELQNSDLDIGTPVIVLHKSRDEKWYYVLTDISDGWVKAENVALGSLEDMNTYLTASGWVVVTAAKADIFSDPEMTGQYDHVRMGTKFLIDEISEKTVKIRFPHRDSEGNLAWKTGYIETKNINQGFLEYTPRHVIAQAFQLLNEPYGWGGMHGEQDCSRFLHEIFSTFGINFPRNSKEQAQAGKILAKFDENSSDAEKLKVLKDRSVGGLTLLGMKGHIMLYLGWADERPYAIHATWGYREPTDSGEDRVCVINRVVVSDLSLGEGSKRGSLLHRIHSIVAVAE